MKSTGPRQQLGEPRLVLDDRPEITRSSFTGCFQ